MGKEILGGRYRILERIGEGGMAFVYVAMDEKLGRKVAIKVLHEHMERNPDIRKRFQHEAQAISGLDHPNIVKIYDFSGSQSDRLWIVTEVIHGKNLAQLVQQFTGGWLHPIIAATIVREICKALDMAHGHGIVHRDIKPENIMVTHEGRVKLMDFGIAKDLGKSSMTVTGTFMGSPSYMSPEQIRGRDVDLRSDLYSLSVLFYEIVTGRLPFTGQTTHDVVMKIMEGGFTHPRFIVPTIPDALNNMIVMGMSKDAAARHQSAREYGRELDTFLTAMKFDESHIELERYFKDRKAYEQRLAQSGQELMQAGTLAARLQQQPAQSNLTTKARSSQSLAELTRQMTRPPVSSNQQPQGARTSTILPPAPRRVAAPRAPGTSRVAQPTRQTQAPRSPFQVNDTWQQHLPAPAASQHAPSGQGQGQHSAIARQPTPAPIAPQSAPRHIVYGVARASPRPKARSQNGAARRALLTVPSRQTWLTQIFGILLVAMIGALCVYGFWELQNRLHENKGSDSSGRKTEVSSPRPVKTGNESREFKKLPRPETPQRPEPIRVKKLPPTPKRNAVVVEPAADPNLRVEAANIKKSKRKINKNNQITKEITKEIKGSGVTPPVAPAKPNIPKNSSVAVIADSKPEPKTEPKLEPKPKTTPVASGVAKAAFSSQPAAEIYVDGRRLGTTVDSTTSSGWLEMSSGERTYELRREGYETIRGRLILEAGEQRQVPRAILRQVTSGSGSDSAAVVSCSLTLRVNATPVQVTIRESKGATQIFSLKGSSRVIDLPAGRYHVKVEYQGAVKEREIILSAGQRSLTFSAEFKTEN